MLAAFMSCSKADVFAGIVLWELATAERPNEWEKNKPLRSAQVAVACIKVSPLLLSSPWQSPFCARPVHTSHFLLRRVPEEAPEELADLVEHCTQYEPKARPTMGDILERLKALPHAAAAQHHNQVPVPALKKYE